LLLLLLAIDEKVFTEIVKFCFSVSFHEFSGKIIKAASFYHNRKQACCLLIQHKLTHTTIWNSPIISHFSFAIFHFPLPSRSLENLALHNFDFATQTDAAH